MPTVRSHHTGAQQAGLHLGGRRLGCPGEVMRHPRATSSRHTSRAGDMGGWIHRLSTA
ncbi:hypothetical protein BD413DRAFT_579322 [Trametes elegans]|nr:hypothetical protein BD413DRAFT_579322 [Trametes elegans]